MDYIGITKIMTLLTPSHKPAKPFPSKDRHAPSIHDILTAGTIPKCHMKTCSDINVTQYRKTISNCF